MTNRSLPPYLIEKLFDDRKYSRLRRNAAGVLKYAFSFTALFLSFFVILNFPAYYSRFKFFLNPPTVAPTKTVLKPVEAPKTEPTTLQPQLNPVVLVGDQDNNRLKIVKIGVDVPIVWGAPFEQIVERLQDGVVHYDGMALPGENGNVFLTGHSSNFWWDKGKFNTVFANLDQVEEGDEIIATYQNVRYRYIVEKKFVVDPSRIEVLNPSDHSIITLMTCTPIGTTINRLIVQAKQVEPKPGQPSQIVMPEKPKNLPAVR